jgi:hypothetical protein
MQLKCSADRPYKLIDTIVDTDKDIHIHIHIDNTIDNTIDIDILRTTITEELLMTTIVFV